MASFIIAFSPRPDFTEFYNNSPEHPTQRTIYEAGARLAARPAFAKFIPNN